MAKQTLTLEIDSVVLFKRRGGKDSISICVNDCQALKSAVGEKIFNEVYEGTLTLDIEVTKGRGEALLDELGLTERKVIEEQDFSFQFSHKQK